MTFTALFGAVATIARHPSLWWTALVQARRLTPRGWWRRRPFLPVPDPAYVRFRLVTMYGDDQRPLDPDDLVLYLRWCRDFPRNSHTGSSRRISPARVAVEK